MKLILFVSFFIIASCSKKQDKILPQERLLVESVYASVTIQPDSLYQAFAVVSGILDANLVEEGDVVLKDSPIIKIINNKPLLNAQNAKYSLELAIENYIGKTTVLSGIQDQINEANLKFKNDSLNYFRQKNLWQQKIGSKLDFDTKKLNYELSQNNLITLKNNYKRTENELETVVKQSKNNYQTALINTKDFTVNSKIKGKVYALFKETGEIVNTTEPLASVGSATNFIIEMLVDEVDIVRIKKGQEVLINIDAYNSEVFKGYVSKIYPFKDERNQTFKIKACFEKPPNKLYPGLSGEANIVISKKSNVLTIPKAYLIDNNKVKTDNGIIPIKIGLQNMEHVEILSGITIKTYIYNPE